MKITWIGQAGLLFDSGTAKTLIDPYLSDSVGQIDPEKHRRAEIDYHLFDAAPDVMIFTHNHLDHFDPETAGRFLARPGKPMTVLCPSSVWQKARAYKNGHNYVQFNRGTQWTEGALRFTAVFAEHSDPFAIGVLIEDLKEEKTYYITGDTLFHRAVFDDLPESIDVVFLPINGVGNNMNAADGARFVRKCRAKKAVPYHIGMFDAISPESLETDNLEILELYKERQL